MLLDQWRRWLGLVEIVSAGSVHPGAERTNVEGT